MKWGSVKEAEWALLERRFKAGKPCEPLETQVSPYVDVMDVWHAFWTLHEGRGYTEAGPSMLRMADIHAYCAMFPPMREAREMVSLLYAMDRQYLAHYQEKQERKGKGSGMSKMGQKQDGRHNRKHRS